jgi:hypothetical protein
MLRSIISQLASWNREPPKALVQYARRQSSFPTAAQHLDTEFQWKSVAQPSFQDLTEILQGILEDFDQSYIVIHTLDECTDQTELLKILSTILGPQMSGLRIFLSSRHIANIADVLSSSVSHAVEAGTEDVGKDI